MHNVLAAVLVLLASFGMVMGLVLFLLRLLLPKEENAFVLTVQTQPDDETNLSKVSYAAERVRFFGEEKCTLILVDCKNLSAAEIQSLQQHCKAYSYVRLIGLDAEKQDLR